MVFRAASINLHGNGIYLEQRSQDRSHKIDLHFPIDLIVEHFSSRGKAAVEGGGLLARLSAILYHIRDLISWMRTLPSAKGEGNTCLSKYIIEGGEYEGWGEKGRDPRSTVMDGPAWQTGWGNLYGARGKGINSSVVVVVGGRPIVGREEFSRMRCNPRAGNAVFPTTWLINRPYSTTAARLCFAWLC